MFAKFKINIEDVRKINTETLTLQRFCTIDEQEDISSEIKLLLENERGIIDGEKIKADYFPTRLKKNYNVFISHSHSDIEEIEKFAKKLHKKYGVNCFVDSMVWKNIVDLQYAIDDTYSRGTNGKMDYELVKQSTAHIHSLLSIALFEMIDQCECCIFVQSDNSLTLDFHDTLTLSPWIYEEIYYMNHTKENTPEHVIETKYFTTVNEQRSVDSRIKMSHVVDLSDFKNFMSYLPHTELRGDRFLQHLYRKIGKIEMQRWI